MLNNDTKIIYETCFFAFLDILGFRSKVIESQDSSVEIGTLIESLKLCGAFPSGANKTVDSSGEHRKIKVRSRFFSDTVVFFMQENPRDIAQLFFIIPYLQDQLWEAGICLRGAITIGDMYWPADDYLHDHNITVGPAMIEAYKMENEIAIYPRIIVSRSLYSYIDQKKIQSYPFGFNNELKDLIHQEEDGVFILDLLSPYVARYKSELLYVVISEGYNFTIQYHPDSGNNHSQVISSVKQLSEKNITADDEKIRQKYQWLKSYVEKSESLGG